MVPGVVSDKMGVSRLDKGAYAERKVKIAWPMTSLGRRILSEMRWTWITLSAQLSVNRIPAPPWADSCAELKNLNLLSLPLKMWAWLDWRQPIHLCSCMPQMSSFPLDKASHTSACLAGSVRMPKSEVETLSFPLELSLLDLLLASWSSWSWPGTWFAMRSGPCFPRPRGSHTTMCLIIVA